MNYVCVLLFKDSPSYQVFDTKQEALEFFDGRFGEEIRKDVNKKLGSLNKRLDNLELDYYGSEREDAKIAKTKSEIASLRRIVENPLVDYTKRLDPWKPSLVLDESRVFLQVGSIYNRCGRYEVVEDKHYVRFEEISYDGNAGDLCKELYYDHRNKGRYIYILNGEDAMERAIKKVVKLRSQFVRDYKKDSARL